MNTFLTGSAFLPLLDEKVSAFLDSINAPSDINSAFHIALFCKSGDTPYRIIQFRGKSNFRLLNQYLLKLGFDMSIFDPAVHPFQYDAEYHFSEDKEHELYAGTAQPKAASSVKLQLESYFTEKS